MLRRIFLLILLFAPLFIVRETQAQNNCKPIYGGGEACITKGKVLLDKKVQRPGTSKFVDNLSRDEAIFDSPRATFQLTIKNTDDKKIEETIVTDTFPSVLDFVSGPGSFDKNTKTLTFKVINLEANQSKKYTIVASVNKPQKMVSCFANSAKTKAGRNESRDNISFCINPNLSTGGFPQHNQVMDAPGGMSQTPPTGPEALALIGLIPAAIGGLLLRRFKI